MQTAQNLNGMRTQLAQINSSILQSSFHKINEDLAKYQEKNYVEITFKNTQIVGKNNLPIKLLLPGISNLNSNRNSNVETPIRGRPM